jgi:hypothetical protein
MKSIQRHLQKSYRPLDEENGDAESQNHDTIQQTPQNQQDHSSPDFNNDSGQNMFVDPDIPSFDTSRIVLEEDIQNATKPPPLVFGKCIKVNSRQACKIFIAVNIGVMFLQLSLHVLEIDENLRLKNWANKLFFTFEWSLSIYGWYGVTRNRHWKVLLYLCWVIYEFTFEFYLVIGTLVNLVRGVNHLHEHHIDPTIDRLGDMLENGNLTDSQESVVQEHHDRWIETKEEVTDVHGSLILHILMTYLVIFAVKIVNIYVLQVHRKYMENTYGREPFRTVLCCF